jgi:hypothetical protein
MISKKLIVYGDSYACSNVDPSLWPEVRHWFHHLVEHYTGKPYEQPVVMEGYDDYDYLNRGIIGTSTFYSLCAFLDDLNVYQPEKVVFVFSQPRRTPLKGGPFSRFVFDDSCAREESKRMNKFERRNDIHEIKLQLKQISAWYAYFLSEEPLIKFLQQSIFDRLQLECKKRNIDLVMLETMSYYDDMPINFSYLEFPVIRNLDIISRQECPDGAFDFLADGDCRAGHLNRTNNKICADQIIKCFDNLTPHVVNLDEMEGLDYSKESFNFFWSRHSDGFIRPSHDPRRFIG